MSGHGQHDTDTALDTGHDDHESSSDDFPADEPRSPAWLPLLGGALFLAGIFVFVAMGSSGKTTEELAKDAAEANPSAAAPAAPGTAPAAPATAPVAAVAPAQRPTTAIQVGQGTPVPANHPQFARPPGN